METVSLNELVAFVTIIVGIVTIIWFIRDVRKQNSKELKNQSEILKEIQESNKEIHKSGERQAKILERINESINESSERQIQSAERQIKILERIESK